MASPIPNLEDELSVLLEDGAPGPQAAMKLSEPIDIAANDGAAAPAAEDGAGADIKAAAECGEAKTDVLAFM